MNYLHGKSILVTGGTGSFGKSFVREILNSHGPRRVAIFSRDELKQSEMRRELGDDSRLRWFIGDVRDLNRLKRALSAVDCVVHAAAMKQVDTAEYNPFECIATNVMGAENVINACIDTGVKKVIALSTDKASSPINLYGASKLCSDKLFVAGNHYAGHDDTRFSVVRYGNVVGSRGSIVPLFKELAESGILPITDIRMTRFWITLPHAVQFVIDSFDRMHGGEIFVPKIPSTKILDIASAIAPNAEIAVIGIRPGEKLHEEMISMHDAFRTIEDTDCYRILPVLSDWTNSKTDSLNAFVPENFSYTSDNNSEWLGTKEIRAFLDLEA